jgi:hypothetical protein
MIEKTNYEFAKAVLSQTGEFTPSDICQILQQKGIDISYEGTKKGLLYYASCRIIIQTKLSDTFILK